MISPAIRVLYSEIGSIIGDQVVDRIINDDLLSPDLQLRKSIPENFIKLIAFFRKELKETRSFLRISEAIDKTFMDYGTPIAKKLLAWIIEAYLLLNQSSVASVVVLKPYASKNLFEFADEIIDKLASRLNAEEIEEIFNESFSANLVLTAHPTAGIQPDYLTHISNMVKTVQKISLRKKSNDSFHDLESDLILSISHMVRAKPYNEDKLLPSDESANFLRNIEASWEIFPALIVALEERLRKKFGLAFSPKNSLFSIHSWVARDIDGNPAVNTAEHLKSLRQERSWVLSRYKKALEYLSLVLSDDFTIDEALPSKTFFQDMEFKKLFFETKQDLPEALDSNKAYRVIIEQLLIPKIDQAINSFEADCLDVHSEILPILLLMKNNKGLKYSKEIDLLIRQVEIFGNFASKGHTRIASNIINSVFTSISGLDDRSQNPELISKKTAFILDIKTTENRKNPDNFQVKTEKQFLELIDLFKFGGIERQIISMNKSFEDMLNMLYISKYYSLFKAFDGYKLPESKIEIVPLTEQISDLRSSGELSLEALLNPAWREYLISVQGRFIKMRGPSDSAKQNGFIASQWYMFKAKSLDLIVVEIFNAFLSKILFENDSEIKSWKILLKEDIEKNTFQLIDKSISSFENLFNSEEFRNRELVLWKKAFEEKGLKEIKLVNFDGWGEPVERGGGLEFEDTVKCTQPEGSFGFYERTIQGGGAQQLCSHLRTKQVAFDFISGLSEISLRRKLYKKSFRKFDLIIKKDFCSVMEDLVFRLRSSLRTEVFGIDLEDDNKAIDEEVLRNYFRHVIKSPLPYLDFFNIASRPTSRSGSKIKNLLEDPIYNYDLDLFIQGISVPKILEILNDIRAIPYAAMFSLLGGNHVSFYGFDKVFSDESLTLKLKEIYESQKSSQEKRLFHHMMNSLEKGIMTADIEAYQRAHELIERATHKNYKSEEDSLIQKIIQAKQNTKNFIACIKSYVVKDSHRVQFQELMQDDPEGRDLLIARKNDAAIPRIALAYTLSLIIREAHEKTINPLAVENISKENLDLLRKAFAAGASTFGNGCID
jgi:phosphoenolpyruvate carboxylase